MADNKKTRVTTYLSDDECVVVVKRNAHYKLGYPVEDIILGETIYESRQVTWCEVEQRWIA